MEEAGNVRLHADALGIHAHEQVVHGGVGTHGQAENAPGRNVGGFAEIGDNGRQGVLDNGILELFPPAGAALLDDAVDDVGTVSDLPVAAGALGQQLAGGQVRQDHGHGCRTNIDGAAHDGGVRGGGDVHAMEGVAL